MPATIFWYSLQRLPVAIAISLLIAGTTYWLYRPQVSGLGKYARWLLPILRAAVMLVITIALLQPVIVRPKTKIEQGTVVFLIDNSRSMSIVDNRRSPAERVAIAAALGRLPESRETQSFAPLQADADRLTMLSESAVHTRNEMDYARLSGRTATAAEARLGQCVDDLSKTAEDAAKKVAGITSRGEPRNTLKAIAHKPALQNRNRWFEQLPDRVRLVSTEIAKARTAADEERFRTDPEVHDASETVASLTRLELATAAVARIRDAIVKQTGDDIPTITFTAGDRLLSVPTETGNNETKLIADGTFTNLTGAIRATVNRFEGTPIRAVIICSDGRQTTGDTSVSSGLSPSGVPIYSVNVASSNQLKDISVSHLTAPNSAFVGETITARADLRATGFSNPAVNVDCAIGNDTQHKRREILDDQPHAVEFRQKLTAAGPIQITLSAPKVAGEATAENNSVSRWVKVSDQKLHIGIFAGTATWDFQYVRNALSRTAWADQREGILSGSGSNFPLKPDEILKQDVILLFDVSVSSLSTAQWDAVKRLAGERGGSVILVAGDAHLPAEYASNAITSALLPYSGPTSPTWRVWPGERPTFHLSPANNAITLDALKLGDADESFMSRWQQLPAMFRILPISPLKQNTKPLLIEPDSGQAILTESRLGIGRSFFFGANETWRWRYKTGETDMDRFWLQLIRYAAEEPYAATTGGISIDADLVSATPQQAVQIRARLLDENGLPLPVTACQLKIVQEDKVIRTQQMAVGLTGSGRFHLSLSGLPAGDYRLILDAGENRPRPEVSLKVQPSLETEMSNLSGDETVLRRLSSASGGDYLRLDQLESLPSRLTGQQFGLSQVVEMKIWDSGYLYSFVLGCLGIEWAVRKKFGLA